MCNVYQALSLPLLEWPGYKASTRATWDNYTVRLCMHAQLVLERSARERVDSTNHIYIHHVIQKYMKLMVAMKLNLKIHAKIDMDIPTK